MGKSNHHQNYPESHNKDSEEGTLLQDITYYCVQKPNGKKVSRFECSNNVRRQPRSPKQEAAVETIVPKQKNLKSSPPSVARSTDTSRSSNTRGRKSYFKGRKKMSNTKSSLCRRCRSCVCSSVANGLCHLPSSSGPIENLRRPTDVTSTSTRINRLSVVYSSSVSSAPKNYLRCSHCSCAQMVAEALRSSSIISSVDKNAFPPSSTKQSWGMKADEDRQKEAKRLLSEVTDALSNAKQSIDRNKVEIDCILGRSESSLKICSKTKLVAEEISDLINSLRSFSHKI